MMTTGCLLLRRTIRLSALATKAVGYPLFLKAFLRWRISILLATLLLQMCHAVLRVQMYVPLSMGGFAINLSLFVSWFLVTRKGSVLFFNLPHKLDGGLIAVDVSMT